MNWKKKHEPGHPDWSYEHWMKLESRTRASCKGSTSEQSIWSVINGHARRVMRTYTTSFFIVSRFLPAKKREEVEAIYAAVRYPDEIVDTFRLKDEERSALLDRWQESYEVGLRSASLKDALANRVPCFLAAFTKVVCAHSIPVEYYRSFLDSMRQDISTRRYSTLEDLIANYIYGSAVVVGYFLTYVYGSHRDSDFPIALESARSLGIALQLTNFLRDVVEDQKRGRVYLPQDLLANAGIESLDVNDSRQQSGIASVRHELALVAEDYYAEARKSLKAFDPDCRVAIDACIKVYGRLNERILKSDATISSRASVPLKEKFRVLPSSKYWRIPYAYLFN